MPPNPRQRMRNKAPAKDIMSAAKDLRKLEVLYDLNLITSKEKAKEQQAIEKYLGINRAEKAKTAQAPTPAPAAAATPAPAPVQEPAKNATVPAGTQTEIIQTQIELTEKPVVPEPATEETSQATPLLPMVSSPF